MSGRSCFQPLSHACCGRVVEADGTVAEDQWATGSRELEFGVVQDPIVRDGMFDDIGLYLAPSCISTSYGVAGAAHYAITQRCKHLEDVLPRMMEAVARGDDDIDLVTLEGVREQRQPSEHLIRSR